MATVAKALRLDNWGVKQALNHPLLKDKKPIGRGVFSAVFEGTRKNTVLKMTVDDISYWMMNDPYIGVTHRHFPRLIESHSEIGSMRIGKNEYPIYLYEVERLKKLEKGSAARRLARLISNAQGDTGRRHGFGQMRSFDILNDMTHDAALPKSIRNALSQLANFCANITSGALDMHLGNFMQRKSGEMVMTDPLANMDIMNSAHAQLRRRGW